MSQKKLNSKTFQKCMVTKVPRKLNLVAEYNLQAEQREY